MQHQDASGGHGMRSFFLRGRRGREPRQMPQRSPPNRPFTTIPEVSPVLHPTFRPSTVAGGLFQQFLEQLALHRFAEAASILHGLSFREECAIDDLESEVPQWQEAWRVEEAKAAGQPLHQLLFKKWVVIGVLLSNVNFLERHILNDKPMWWKLCLTIACERMNIAMLTLIENLSSIRTELLPYPVIDVVLKRHRLIFVRARSVNLRKSESVLPRFANILSRKLNFAEELSKGLHLTAVNLIADLLEHHVLTFEKIKSETTLAVIARFHRVYPNEVALRIKVYFRYGTYLILKNHFNEAREQLCNAFDLCPSEHPNALVIYTALVAAHLACGMLPSQELVSKFYVPEYDDFFIALESGNLQLYDYALRNCATFFLERQLLNALHAMQSWVMLSLVVKFYVKEKATATTDKIVIDLNVFKEWCSPPAAANDDSPEFDSPELSSSPAATGLSIGLMHILPLIRKGEVRGVIQSQYLIFARNTPFPSYAKVLERATPPPPAPQQ